MKLSARGPLLGIAFGLLLGASARADDKEPTALAPAWHGDWRGQLVITGPGDKRSELAMRLVIEPIKDSSEFTWKLTYGEGDKAQLRDYKLVPVPGKPGRFRIDERNGIVLDARLVNDVIYCPFEVGGAVLSTRYELRGDTLRFDVTSSKPLAEKTGDGKVRGYDVDVVQSAELRKK